MRNRRSTGSVGDQNSASVHASLLHTRSAIAGRQAGVPLLIRHFGLSSSAWTVSWGVTAGIENIGDKDLKYVHLDVVPYNRVYDVVREPGVRPVTRTLTIVGPGRRGATMDGTMSTGWVDPDIRYARIERIRVVFVDDKEWDTSDHELITESIVTSPEYQRHATQMGPRFEDPAVAFAPPPSTTRVPESSAQWDRPAPGPTELIVVSNRGYIDDRSTSVFSRSANSVISVIGDKAAGSGFFISADGYAVTNHHVVAGQTALRVRLRDGSETDVRVLRTNPETDIALLEVRVPESTPLRIDNQLVVEPGLSVLAIGTPLGPGLSYTVTRGIVSGLRYTGAATVLQTDAAVNPGNSGGPLIHEDSGAVIGIVSAQIVGIGIEGVAFATDVLDALRSIGVRITDADG